MTSFALSFAPDAQRAGVIDDIMRARLADGLETVAREAASLEPPVVLDLDEVVARIRGARQTPPSLWAHYASLCHGVALDDLEGVLASAGRLRSLAVGSSRRLCNLTDDDLGDGGAALYARTIDDDESMPLALRPADPATYARLAELLPAALELVSTASDDLAGEIDIFGRQLVLVTGKTGETTFGGAATVFLWGAVMLNPEFAPTRLRLAEAIVHECSHALLTGLTGGDDVTTNDREARYPSPLRRDPRPMEGIAHATFVLARMIDALDRIALKAQLAEDERTELAAMQADNLRLFRDGAKIVQASARFTPTGEVIFANCFAAMRQLA